MNFTSQWDTKYRANPKTNDSLSVGEPRPFVIKHITQHIDNREFDFRAEVSLVENGVGGELYLWIEILKDEKEFGFTLRPDVFEQFLDTVNKLVNPIKSK
jgi:hypothetical protein